MSYLVSSFADIKAISEPVNTYELLETAIKEAKKVFSKGDCFGVHVTNNDPSDNDPIKWIARKDSTKNF